MTAVFTCQFLISSYFSVVPEEDQGPSLKCGDHDPPLLLLLLLRETSTVLLRSAGTSLLHVLETHPSTSLLLTTCELLLLTETQLDHILPTLDHLSEQDHPWGGGHHQGWIHLSTIDLLQGTLCRQVAVGHLFVADHHRAGDPLPGTDHLWWWVGLLPAHRLLREVDLGHLDLHGDHLITDKDRITDRDHIILVLL